MRSGPLIQDIIIEDIIFANFFKQCQLVLLYVGNDDGL